jgi:SNF2 domain-containing protein
VSAPLGKLSFREELGWILATSPHVALRAKRIFPKIAPHQQGWLKLSDTTENARELEWFLRRYPHDVSKSDAARLRKRARQHREKETLVARMLAGIYRPADFPMALPPRPYQSLAAELWRANLGLLLADEMGTGKSVAAIAGICDPQLRPALVACMAHLPKQWLRFFRRFAPHLKVHILRKGSPYDLRGRFHILRKDDCSLSMVRGRGEHKNALPDVIISSYSKLVGWAGTLSELIRSVIWDECQELRHHDTGKHNAACCIADAARWRIGLSGTPIYNYGIEMWNVLRCISPDTLGTKEEFRTEWCQFGDEVKDPRAFGSYLQTQGVLLRRTRADIGRELPKCSSIVHCIEADADTLERETSTCEDLALVILAGTESWKGQKMHAAGQFDMLLRQATGLAKAPYVAEFVRMLLETEEKVVLYGWHRAVYDEWLKRLIQFRPVLYTGSETSGRKEYSKTQFLRRDAEAARVMMISLRSGAGLDGLQEVCSTAVFGELDWSPGVHEQCTMRIDRDGQTRPVFAYYLLSETGSDPIVADICGLKRRQLEGIRDPGAELIERLTVDPQHVKKLAEAYLKGRKHKDKGFERRRSDGTEHERDTVLRLSN